MSAGTRPPSDPRTRDVAPARSDRSPWNWLLLVAVVVPLLVPLYNRVEPTLFGWPFFYWMLVYRATRRSPAERAAAREAADRTNRER
jgi:hypothetical protein